MFYSSLNKYARNVCLIADDVSLTYKDVENMCESFGKSLPNKKQLILIKVGSNIETIVAYLSSLSFGHACIMLDKDVNQSLISNIIDIYQVNYICEEINVNEDYAYEFGNYGLRRNNYKDLNIHPNLALMLSTSGTTGSPKMVKLTTKNLCSNADSIVKYLNIDSSHRSITNLPLSYSYGLSILNTHLTKGASVVVTNESIMSKKFWQIFSKFNVTTLNGVPYSYDIFRRIGLMKMDLPSLKYMTQAGGKLNQRTVINFAQWANEKGISFYIMYGQTEATARMSYLPHSQTLIKPSSIGVPIPGGEFLIKDIGNDRYLDEGEGELVYRGSNVMMGYATCLDDLEKDCELNGLLKTGDIGKRDCDGYFYITGRLKRFIKIYGNRVSLDEIENFLKLENYDVLCTGVDNQLMICCLDHRYVEEIKQVLLKEYKFHHSVIKVKHFETYPVTNSGKIRYQQIMDEFL